MGMLIDPGAHIPDNIETLLAEKLGGAWAYIEPGTGCSVFESNKGDRIAVYLVDRMQGRPPDGVANFRYTILKRGGLL